MNPNLAYFLTFISGALYEFGCTFWVHYAESNRIFLAVIWSMFNAIVTIIGTEGFLINWKHKVLFILGFGTGTGFAIMMKVW